MLFVLTCEQGKEKTFKFHLMFCSDGVVSRRRSHLGFTHSVGTL